MDPPSNEFYLLLGEYVRTNLQLQGIIVPPMLRSDVLGWYVHGMGLQPQQEHILSW